MSESGWHVECPPPPLRRDRLPERYDARCAAGPKARLDETRAAARAKSGGEEGIRTPGSLSASTVFKTAALNHSATSPRVIGSVTSSHLLTASSAMVQKRTSGGAGARL